MHNESRNELLQRLTFIANHLPETRLALIDEKTSLSYRSMVEAVSNMAAQLREWNTQAPIRVIALRCGNSTAWVIFDLACQVADMVCIPLPLFFSQAQCDHCIRTAAVDLFVTDNEFNFDRLDSELLAEAWPPPFTHLSHINFWHLTFKTARHALIPEGTQKITFTSGSTGEPKGVCLSAAHQWQVAESLADAVNVKAPQHLCLLPLSTLLENIGGVYAPLLNGGTVILASEAQRGMLGSSTLDSTALQNCISKYSPQTLILVPQLLSALLVASIQGWVAPTSIEFVAVGGAKVAMESILRARAIGIPAYEGYGLSECASVVALNTPQRERLGSVGHILPHCQVSMIDGEITISGACHLGYLGLPDSWHPTCVHTGDLGTVDADNFLAISGRKKNILISAFGRNIQPEWIESEITANPVIHHCVLVGEAKPFLIAIISANDDISNDTISQWINKVNSNLPDYARVRRWIRPDPHHWLNFLSANGRAKRDVIQQVLASIIEREYAA